MIMNLSDHFLRVNNNNYKIQEQQNSISELYRNTTQGNDTEFSGPVFLHHDVKKTPFQTNQLLKADEVDYKYTKAIDILQTSLGRRFFRCCTAIPPAYGIQYSVKVEPGQVIDRRIQLGCDKRQKTQQEWMDWFHAVGTPHDVVTHILDAMPCADNIVMFGIEEKDDTATLKIYLEFLDGLRSLIQQGKLEFQPLLLSCGYKWLVDDTTKWFKDDYWFHPLTLPEIRNRLTNNVKIEKMILVKLLDPLLFNNKAVSSEQVMYLEVASDDNARRSFDIACYPCEISVEESMPYILEVAQNWGCWEQLKRKLLPFSLHLLEHISAGIHRENQFFLTLYISEDKKAPGIGHLPVSTDKNNSRSQNLCDQAASTHAASAHEVRKDFKTNSGYVSNSRPEFTIINMPE